MAYRAARWEWLRNRLEAVVAETTDTWRWAQTDLLEEQQAAEHSSERSDHTEPGRREHWAFDVQMNELAVGIEQMV